MSYLLTLTFQSNAEARYPAQFSREIPVTDENHAAQKFRELCDGLLAEWLGRGELVEMMAEALGRFEAGQHSGILNWSEGILDWHKGRYTFTWALTPNSRLDYRKQLSRYGI